MKIDGSCHCGKITYQAEVDPEKVGICHCTDCQQLTGTAFRVTVFAAGDDFQILTGEPKIYVKTTADNGNPRAQGFCADCGSQLFATSVGDGPKSYGIRVGTARQRAQLVPKRQVWHQSALPWLDQVATMPAIEKGG